MIITNNLEDYIISLPFETNHALSKIEKNSIGGLVVIKNERLFGTLTDGDIRRFLIENKNKEIKISDCINQNPLKSFSNNKDSINQIFLHSKINFIPIIDNSFKVTSIAISRNIPFKIDHLEISDTSPCRFIAEIGNNHNGDIVLAKEMIDAAKESGAEIVKFQMRQMETIYGFDESSKDLGVEYTLDLLSKNQLSNDEILDALNYAKNSNIIPLCTPWDSESAKILFENEIKAFKVASADLTNHKLISDLVKFRLPIILSTGMSLESEIIEAKNIFERSGAQYLLMHCNSTYPAPYEDLNLRYIQKLREFSFGEVGYSSHERGYHAVLAAISLGAKLIEKHFTFDKTMEGIDHKVSLLPGEFKEMIIASKEIESAMGFGSDRYLSQGEIINRENLSKSIVASKKINTGDVFKKEDLTFKSPGSGLQPNKIDNLIGKVSSKNYQKGEMIFENLQQDSLTTYNLDNLSFKFNRPWGFPVRYHDIDSLTDLYMPDLLEIHLSYSDLNLNTSEYFNKKYNLDLVVHAPELFENDFILDLCSDDNKIRKKSIDLSKKVIDHALNLKDYFETKLIPKIIFNVGGFSQKNFLTKEEIEQKYDFFSSSIESLLSTEYEFLPQTMPPFPWHFGGQQFHNLFNNPDDITRICEELEMNICIDISHAKMYTTFNKISLEDYLSKIGKYGRHLHISDSLGHGGEGIQIAEGEINWPLTLECLDEYCPKASFIPEVWQSHKNRGEGIWVALDRLQSIWNSK